MNDNTPFLLPIATHTLNDQLIQTIDARKLHDFLEVGKDFSTWIKDRIEQYKFIEDQDFIIITNSGDNSKRGPKFKDYHLTLDMAKELAMVERNEKGRQARRYFIQCEKTLQGVSANLDQIIANAIGKVLPAILDNMVPKLVDEKFKSDPRVAVVHGISARELLDREKVPSKGRRGLLLRTTNGLSNLCLEQGKKVERCARTKTKLYPTHVADAWLELHGRSLIKAHMEAVTGQGVLMFPKKGIECRTGEKEERS